MKRLLILAAALIPVFAAAQQGGINSDLLKELKESYKGTPYDRAVRNALNTASIAVLASNAENAPMMDTHFSDRVRTKGITDQKQSGRCWLFTGLNVLRAAAIDRHNLGDFQFSQGYVFFYDQLEKANLFLQAVIDTRDLKDDDRTVDWLFSHPISDGGTFTGVADLVTKYGLVPSTVMAESFAANSTSALRSQLSTLLRQDGLALRNKAAAHRAKNASLKGKKAAQAKEKLESELLSMKKEMLKDVYHVLAITIGVPPESFEWTMYNAKGDKLGTKTYTPLEFCAEMVGGMVCDNYVMVMNDPCREYGKVYEIEYDRHTYDGHNWLYVNLPLDRIKEMAISSIKDNTAMYFSCDVAKFLDRKKGTLDLKNFDYSSLLGVEFTMDKRERILTHASGSSHAMTLIAVDLRDGKPQKWMVENSWGASNGYKGCLVMTDEWFDEYMFRLVFEKKYVPQDILDMLSQTPVKLPAWDPMFLSEE